MDKFVARENIRHFCDRLRTETDPTTRSLLQRLLVQEEDKFGYNSEALHEIENYIARAKGHVNRQLAVVASIPHDGRNNTTQALILLNAYNEILVAYENQREKILTKLQESRF